MRATKATIQAFTKHAQAEYPKEACGFAVMVGRKQVFVPVTNRHSDPEEAFQVSGEDWAEAEDRGDIVALLHSHCGDGCLPIPSDVDRQQCNELGITYGILALPAGLYDELEPVEAPLVGRPFILGSWDCYGLVMDWHRKQGVELTDRRVAFPWWESQYSENLYYDHWEEDGFIECDPCPGAMVIMQVSAGKWNHSGIITEDGQLLHHLYGMQSCVVPYAKGYFRDRTVLTVRHKDLPKEIKPWR